MYYRSKETDNDLYIALKQAYAKYITKEMLEQCNHNYNTQVNEGMNTSIARYAPKSRHYSKSTSLSIRVHIAAAVYNVGYHHFFKNVLEALEIEPPRNLMIYLAKKDKEKMGKYYKSHTKKAKRFRQKDKNRKQAAHVKKALDDAKKNAGYGPATGVEGQTNNVTTYTDCKYSCYGCVTTQKSKKHKTNCSKWVLLGQGCSIKRKCFITYF